MGAGIEAVEEVSQLRQRAFGSDFNGHLAELRVSRTARLIGNLGHRHSCASELRPQPILIERFSHVAVGRQRLATPLVDLLAGSFSAQLSSSRLAEGSLRFGLLLGVLLDSVTVASEALRAEPEHAGRRYRAN